MSRSRLPLPYFCLAVVVGSAASIQAEVVTYHFSGEIRETTGALFARRAGDRFSGYWTYDTTAPVTSSNPNVGFYLTALQRLFVDGSLLNPFAARVNNQDPGLADSMELYGGPDFNDVRLTLVDSSGTVFSSLALPSTVDVDDFNLRQIIKLPGGTSGRVRNVGIIDTLTRLPKPPALNPVTVFTDQPTFLQQAPIVHTSNFENLPAGGLGNPLEFEAVTYTTRLSGGTISGEFIRKLGSDGLGLGNNSHSRMTLTFGEDQHVSAVGLALQPQFAAAGEWRIVVSLIDGGTEVAVVPYGDDLPMLYRGFDSTVGIRSVDIITFGTSNMLIDAVSYAAIVPEPSAAALAICGMLAGFLAIACRKYRS